MGLAGNSSVSLNQGFAGNILNHAPDLVILENAILNDSQSSTLAGAYTNISQLYDKFDTNNLLVISIATHRFLIGLETIQYDRSNIIRGSIVTEGMNIIGVKHFYPDFVKLVKMLSNKHKYPLIDICLASHATI